MMIENQARKKINKIKNYYNRALIIKATIKPCRSFPSNKMAKKTKGKRKK